MMLKSLLRRAVAALGLTFLLIGAPGAARAPQAAHPALWEVSDADTTIYLFGTIHLLPENYQWRTAKFDQAVAELAATGGRDDRRRQEPDQAHAAMSPASASPRACRRSSQRVPPAKRAALAAAIKKSGVPAPGVRPDEDLDRRRSSCSAISSATWASRAAKASRRCFATPSSAKASRSASSRPTSSSSASSTRLPEKAQRRAAAKARSTSRRRMSEEFDGMLDAWSRGDVEGIARTFDRDLAGSPELAAGADPPAQRQLEQVDRAAHGAARSGHDRGRRGPSGGQGIGASRC